MRFSICARAFSTLCFGLAVLTVSAAPTEFKIPGAYTYTVPINVSALQVVIKGAGGGAGGWDDAHGGDGAPGSIITATIAVKGGENVSVVVAEGGQGAQGGSNYGVGGVGGGVSLALPGAGGNGGHEGTENTSPGGAGGGGASFLKIGGATILAGGGGGGGSNSRVRGADNTWQIPGTSAVNSLVLNEQDPACSTALSGGDGISAGAIDGSGGSGGGGGYTGHAGVGGNNGEDRSTSQNGEPGTSGSSCTLDSGVYKVTVSSAALGDSVLANRTQRGTQEASGENGSVSITPVPAVLYTLTPNAEAHGSIDPSSPQSVRAGEIVTLTVTPEEGYLIDQVSGCGGSLSGSIYTSSAVTADCTVNATFKLRAISSPSPTPVPTINQWALIFLSICLIGFSSIALRSFRGNR